MPLDLTAQCLDGYNDRIGTSPHIWSSPAWMAFRAGQAISSMSTPRKCTQSRGYTVRITTAGGSTVRVRFAGTDLSTVTIERS